MYNEINKNKRLKYTIYYLQKKGIMSFYFKQPRTLHFTWTPRYIAYI